MLCIDACTYAIYPLVGTVVGFGCTAIVGGMFVIVLGVTIPLTPSAGALIPTVANVLCNYVSRSPSILIT